jgi:hypothetical protein
MVKLQEELIISIGKKNKSGSINRFESLFLQFKKIKKPCQEKNDILQKKFFPRPIRRNSKKVATPVKTGVQRLDNPLGKVDSGACPGPDPGFAGMMNSTEFRILTSLSIWMVNGKF